MESAPILVLQFSLSLIGYSLIAAWLVGPWLARKPLDQTLTILVLPHVFRHVGASLLVPGLVKPTLPAEFARATAAGDLLTVGLALVSLAALRFRFRYAVATVWVFNAVGLVDLVANLIRGLALEVADSLGAAWFAPTFIVPAMLVAHVMLFSVLVRRASVRPGASVP